MGQTLHLVRRDAGRNMARFYRLEVERDLFGAVVLIRRWGRIGSAGRSVVAVHGSWAEAEAALSAVGARKARRGYHAATLETGQGGDDAASGRGSAGTGWRSAR